MVRMNRAAKEILAKAGLVAAVCFVVFVIWYSDYRNDRANEIVLKSRYTFSVHIDDQGNVLQDPENNAEKSHTLSQDFGTLSISQIGDIWISEFTKQFTAKYLSWSKALRKVQVYDTKIIDEKNNIVLISFSADLRDTTSEYFSSWNGVLDDGRLYCEWVVQFDIDNHYDGTATIYAHSIVTPEDYGIAQYNASLKDKAADTVLAGEETQKKLTNYEIKNQTLLVTFDGGERYVSVPVDCGNLMFVEGSETELKSGSYTITTTKTAFLYGGNTVNGSRIPVTLIFSNDRGQNWVTCEIDQIYDASNYYVEFFDEEVGVIVVGYGKKEQRESSRIYTTADGGETWNMVGAGPTNNVIKGIQYVNEDIGFFCYEYVEGMDSNLYITKDAGKTFAKVLFEPQELDSTAANSQTTAADGEKATQAVAVNGGGTSATTAADNGNTNTGGTAKLEWQDVYKDALVPVYDTEGVLTVYLTQGKDGVYNSGKTAAKYQSTDKGNTWKYIGQYEINVNSTK